MEGKKLVAIISDAASTGKWKKALFDLHVKQLYNNEVFSLITKCLSCFKKKGFLIKSLLMKIYQP